jgi:putative Mg2+ transporter-C (MgtC) family protein
MTNTIPFLSYALPLLIAMGLGMALGVERFIAGKSAGMRTYALIALGSALFVTISQVVADANPSFTYDPLRIAAQVVAAAGFLGVAAIFHKDNQVSGVTTASGLWVASGIGMACGFGLYQIALFVTILSLVIFIFLWFFEKGIRGLRKKNPVDAIHISE